MKLGIFHFELLYNVLQDMHFLYDEEEMADTVLSKISQALDAEAGTIFRVEKEGELYPLAAFGASKENLRKLKFQSGQGVVGWVAQYMQPVKVDKPDADPRFLGRIDTTNGFKTRSIIAAPIIVRNEMIGIIEFLNRRTGPFVNQDLELISMVGRQVGIAMINARVVTERDNLLAFQEAVVGSLSAGLLVIGPKGQVTKMNRRALEIVGMTEKDKWEGEELQKILSFSNDLVSALQETAETSTPKPRLETMAKVNGIDKRIGYSTVPVVGKSGDKLGAALLFQDITKYAS
jgi:GAF domain-containing protein